MIARRYLCTIEEPPVGREMLFYRWVIEFEARPAEGMTTVASGLAPTFDAALRVIGSFFTREGRRT
jgi:hypothetical protein